MQKGTLVRLRRDELPITYKTHGALWVATNEVCEVPGYAIFKSLATGYERVFDADCITTEIDDAEGHTG